jgi:hypothetical protein
MFAGSPPFEGTIGVAVRASEFRLFVKAAGEHEFYDEVEAFPEAGTRFLVHDFGAGTTFARDAAGKANSLVVHTENQPDWRAASAITPSASTRRSMSKTAALGAKTTPDVQARKLGLHPDG